MKIKNKIKFNPFYAVMGLLGAAILITFTILIRTGIVSNIWVEIVVFGIGGGFFGSGVQRIFRQKVKWRDPKLTVKELNEEKDERNQLITMKARAKLYELMQSAEIMIFISLCINKEIQDLYCYALLAVILIQGIWEIILRRVYERRF